MATDMKSGALWVFQKSDTVVVGLVAEQGAEQLMRNVCSCSFGSKLLRANTVVVT